MKQLIAAVFFCVLTSVSHAAELIKIYSPYSASHSGTPAMMRIIDQANRDQNIYRFLLEFRPGGNQLIAIKAIEPDNSLAIIAPAFVEHVAAGRINERDYRPVYALGDACWAVIVNKPLQGAGEFVVGGVGIGNAAHLTALAMGQRYGFKVRYIVFRSNNDALVNMAGDNGVEFVIDRYEAGVNLQTKNPRLQIIAASCPQRLPQAPGIPTLAELKIGAPYVFNIVIAHRDMLPARQLAIGKILDAATRTVGAQEIFALSAMRPPLFDNVSTEDFYDLSVGTVRTLQNRFRQQIEAP